MVVEGTQVGQETFGRLRFGVAFENSRLEKVQLRRKRVNVRSSREASQSWKAYRSDPGTILLTSLREAEWIDSRETRELVLLDAKYCVETGCPFEEQHPPDPVQALAGSRKCRTASLFFLHLLPSRLSVVVDRG